MNTDVTDIEVSPLVVQRNAELNTALRESVSAYLKYDTAASALNWDSVYAHLPQAAFALAVLPDHRTVQLSYVRGPNHTMRFSAEALRELQILPADFTLDVGDVAAAAVIYGALGLNNREASNRLHAYRTATMPRY